MAKLDQSSGTPVCQCGHPEVYHALLPGALVGRCLSCECSGYSDQTYPQDQPADRGPPLSHQRLELWFNENVADDDLAPGQFVEDLVSYLDMYGWEIRRKRETNAIEPTSQPPPPPPGYQITLHTDEYRGDRNENVTIAVAGKEGETVGELLTRVSRTYGKPIKPTDHVVIRLEKGEDD